MHDLFDRLLISSPNEGGLFLVNNNRAIQLDNLNTTGISKTGGTFLRGQQPSSLWICRGQTSEVTNKTVSFDDIHDVLCYGENIYLVGTAKNEIIKLDQNGVEVKRWVFDGEDDSRHINCLGIWNKRIIFSAFGEFGKTREYKDKTMGAGYVQDLLSGKRLIVGLSQPHSLVPNEKNLLVANSEKMEICEYAPTGDLIRTQKLDGYTRGICISGKVIYVGLSRSRNIDHGDVKTAALVALDRETWDEMGRLSLPVNEIYSVLPIGDMSQLLDTIVSVASYSSVKCNDQIVTLNQTVSELNDEAVQRGEWVLQLDVELNKAQAQIIGLNDVVAERNVQINSLQQTVSERDTQIADLNQAVAERDVQIADLNQAVAERDAQITDLNQAVAERDVQIADLNQAVAERDNSLSSIYSSKAWKLISRFRLLLDRLCPQYTRRRRLYEAGLKAALVIRQRGWFALGRAIAKHIKRRLLGRASDAQDTDIALIVRSDSVRERKQNPLVSIVLHVEDVTENIVQQLHDVLSAQTISNWELVILALPNKEFLRIGGDGAQERGSISGSVLDLCSGEYLYSPAVMPITYPPNWLEINLLSLVSQDLLVTCNSFDSLTSGESVRIVDEAMTLADARSNMILYHRALASDVGCSLDLSKLYNTQIMLEQKAFGRIVSWHGVAGNSKGRLVPIIDVMEDYDGMVGICEGFLIPSASSAAGYVDVFPVDQLIEPQRTQLDKPVILIHLPMLAIGGAEKLTYDLLNCIKDRFEFVIVTSERLTSEFGSTHEMFAGLGAIIYDLGECAVPQIQFSMLSYLVKKYDPITLFVANGSNFFYGHLQAIRDCFPRLRIVNQLFDHEAGWITRYGEQGIDVIDVHIACNQKIEDAYIQRFDIPEEKIACIHHGIDLTEFHGASLNAESKKNRRLEFGVPEDKIVVCFAARLHPQKRPNDFLKLAKRFEHDSRYYFLMVGDGPLRENVDEFIELYQLNNFKKIGFHQPISDVLAISDVLIITSEYEGLPLVLLNALAMSVAVVSTDVGSVSDVLSRDGAGIVVSSVGNVDQLSEALLQATEGLVEMRLKGEKTVREAHDIKKKALEYVRAFTGETGGVQ